MKSIFITGTDTAVGKTYVTRLLLQQLNQRGYQTFGIKPIASGCQYNAQNRLENDDALALQQASSLVRPYETVNPIALKDSIAPHLAALNMGITLSKADISNQIVSSIQTEADINLIEGIGGWAVPLNDHELFAEVIAALNIPIILVVNIKLGCLNHAILTYHHMMKMGVTLIGWIANCLEIDMLETEPNIQTLKQWIHAPCLDTLLFDSDCTQRLNVAWLENYFNEVVFPDEKARMVLSDCISK